MNRDETEAQMFENQTPDFQMDLRRFEAAGGKVQYLRSLSRGWLDKPDGTDFHPRAIYRRAP